MHLENQQDGWWERQLLSLEKYRTGANLSSAEKRAILDVGDFWKIALLENTLVPCQRMLYASLQYLPSTFGYYCQQERRWMNDEFYYLGMNLHHPPTSQEKEKDFEQRRIHTRFRLFYALKWPEQMRLRESLSEQEECIARAFFTRADDISFRKYVQHYFGGLSNDEAPPSPSLKVA